MRGRPAGGRRARRFAFVVLAFVLGFEAALQVALNSGLIPALVGRGGDIRIEWRAAWALWPTRVHLTGFQLWRREDFGWWQLAVRRADVDFDPGQLLQRRFVTRHLDVRGVAVSIDTSHPRPKPPPPPGPRMKGRRWGFELDDIHLHDLDELSFAGLRFAGRVEGRGSFEKTQARFIGVRGAQLHFRDLRVSSAGGGHGTVDRLDLQGDGGGVKHKGGSYGQSLLRGLVATASVEASWEALDWLGAFTAQDPELLRGGAGRLAGELRLDRGTIAEGTRLDARGDEVTVAAGVVSFVGPYEWRLTVPRGGPLRLDARLSPMEVRDANGRRRFLEAPALDVSLEAGGHDLSDLVSGYEVRLRVERATVAARGVAHVRRQPIELTRGRFSVHGRLRLPVTPGAQASAVVRGDALAGRWGNTLLAGAAEARVRVGPSTSGLPGRFSGGLTARARVRVGAREAPLFAKVELRNVAMNRRAGTLEGSASGRLSDATPLVVLLGNDKPLPKLLAWALDLGALSVTGRVRLSPRELALDDLDMACGETRVRGRLATVGGDTWAVLLMDVSAFTVGVEVDEHGTHTHLSDPEAWFRARRAAPRG